MHLVQMPEFVFSCYQSKLVPFFWGSKGVGKSDGVVQSARYIAEKIGDKNFGLIDLRLGTQEVGDLIGIPRVKEVTLPNGEKEFRTVYGKPEWWPLEGTNGILFLDEFNRAGTNDVIQAMFQLVLGYKDKNGIRRRKLHTHELPEGWSIVCAGNPDTADYVVQSIDTAMLDRFIQVKIDVKKEVSVQWLQKNLKNEEIWKFVKATGNALSKKEKFQIIVEPTPRSYEFLDDLLKFIDEDQFNQFGLEAISGILGEEVGMLCYQHLKETLVRPLTAKEVMNNRNFDKFVEEKVKKYLSKDKNRFELIEVTLTDILGEIEKKEPTEFQAENISNFLQLLPADLRIKFIEKGVLLEKNFVPVILTYMPESKNEQTLEMIEAMGFSKEESLEAVKELENLKAQLEDGVKTKVK